MSATGVDRPLAEVGEWHPAVVVTGVGVISPLGDRIEAVHRALCRDESGLRPVASSLEAPLRTRHGGHLDRFDAASYLPGRNLRPLDRTARLAAAAADLALESSAWRAADRDGAELGLVLGTLFGSAQTISSFDRRAITAGPAYAKPLDFANSVINAAAGQTAICHDLRGVNSTMAGGITAGLAAIAYASQLLRAERADAILAGGADEWCIETHLAFDRAGWSSPSNNGAPGRCVPWDRRRDGFVLAEGAAFLMLEREPSARARGAAVLAEVVGHANGLDPSQGRDPERTAEAVARVIGAALADAGVTPADLDVVLASANGSPAGDLAEGRGLARALGARAATIPVTSAKAQVGEMLGAGGALHAGLMLEVMRSGVVPGIKGLQAQDPRVALGGLLPTARRTRVRTGLIHALGQDGHSCAVVLRAVDPPDEVGESATLRNEEAP